ncbi:ATP-binding cassette domain-containing protein [Leptolyngbya sp. 7M]|nr:ATP-binding cassette domain-containing protein [Leptolyngbya sp. 7M]
MGYPSIYLVAQDISYAVSATETLFNHVQVSIAATDRIALVGRNGIGKSTFLQILAGLKESTQGGLMAVRSFRSLKPCRSRSTVKISLRLIDFGRRLPTADQKSPAAGSKIVMGFFGRSFRLG